MVKYIKVDDLVRAVKWEHDDEAWEIEDGELNCLTDNAVEISFDALDKQMQYYSVTFTHKYEGVFDYEPRTAVFSTREKAEAFADKVMDMHDKRDQDYLVVTIDCGTVDSEAYYEWFEQEMRDE